jgi:tetratricopeptide (TPR) repeat protein
MVSKDLRSALVGCILVFLILAGPCAAEQNIVATGGVAIGHDVENSSITIGIPAEKLPSIIEAATKDWRALTDQQKQNIDELQRVLGVNENALKAFFATLGDKEVPISHLSDKLVEIAGHYKELLAQSGPSSGDSPEIAKIKNAARDAVEAGQLDRADELLEQVEKLQEAAIAAEQLELAHVLAQRGQLAMSQLRYQGAAQQFADAAKRVPEERGDIRLHYLDQEADALYHQGHERGDNTALKAAIERYRRLLTLRPRDRVPLDWAMTQVNLGNVLTDLGRRESATARLEEALVAYRAALGEYTPERAPLNWATTQTDLGNALFALGERESDTAHLEEAVSAYRAALEVRTRDRVPLQWAMTQMNLGNALEALGERESDTAHLEDAVAAYRSALEERTRERTPLDWAMTQMNLGTALEMLGEWEGGTARLEEAVSAYRAALEVRTRDRVPLQWAMTQMNLGNALETLGEREAGTARLEDAVAAYRAALEERTRERTPLDWELTQYALGTALRALGERESATVRLKTLQEAVEAWDACLTIAKLAWPPQWLAVVQGRRDETQAEIGRLTAR